MITCVVLMSVSPHLLFNHYQSYNIEEEYTIKGSVAFKNHESSAMLKAKMSPILHLDELSYIHKMMAMYNRIWLLHLLPKH